MIAAPDMVHFSKFIEGNKTLRDYFSDEKLKIQYLSNHNVKYFFHLLEKYHLGRWGAHISCA